MVCVVPVTASNDCMICIIPCIICIMARIVVSSGAVAVWGISAAAPLVRGSLGSLAWSACELVAFVPTVLADASFASYPAYPVSSASCPASSLAAEVRPLRCPILARLRLALRCLTGLHVTLCWVMRISGGSLGEGVADCSKNESNYHGANLCMVFLSLLLALAAMLAVAVAMPEQMH